MRPNRQKILIVDDEPDTRESLSILLEMEGHEVRCASNGRQAVEAFIDWRPNAVLLDIDMPVMSGYEVARTIRASGRRVLLIAITGWSADDGQRRSTDAGFDAYFEKPVPIETLSARLAALGRPGRQSVT